MTAAKGKSPQRATTRAPRRSAAYIAQLEQNVAVPLADQVEDAERRAQAEFEGIDGLDDVELCGRKFRLNPKAPLMPLLRFANVAAQGTETGDMEGLAAMYTMLRSSIYPGTPACGSCPACTGEVPRPDLCPAFAAGDWGPFEAWATEAGAGAEELFGVVTQALEKVMSRPMSQGSGSSPSGSATGQNSRGRSPSQAGGLTPVADRVS